MAAAALNDVHYGVVVGINRYPGLSDLKGPRRDAHDFAEWLNDPAGGALPAENVRKVLVTEQDEKSFKDTTAARPTNIEIDDALRDLTRQMLAKLEAEPQAWERSRLYFYVAGHGFAPQGGEGALLLANADAETLARNIELMQYRRWCTNCAWFRHVVIFVDCCRTRVRSAAPGHGPTIEECPAPWQGKGSTFVIGFGSTVGKPTYERPPEEADDAARGYFTQALLEGLRGGAARDDSGAITIETLTGFVKSLVKVRTENKQYPQEATIYAEAGGEVRFGNAVATAAPPKRTVTIKFPAAFAGAATVVKDEREIAQWQGQGPEWELELEDGVYEVVADGVAFAGEGLFKVAGKDRDVTL